MDKQDYLRFIHCLFEFNDTKTAKNMFYYLNKSTSEVEPHYLKNDREPRELLVEIMIFTLMPNHFHLLLKQKKEDGIVKFMQKLGTGYTMYFNQKYDRVGSLFQGRFKAIDIIEHAHFLHLPFYIHSNPLKLANYRGSTSLVEQMKFLGDYKWSSFADYIGKKNMPSITQRDFLLDYWGGQEKYKKEMEGWLEAWKDTKDIFGKIGDVALEKF